VGKIPQPIKSSEGSILTANCEIYNWQELNKKYDFKSNNDADFLLNFLDKFDLEKIEELDGVFAFAYLKKDHLYLVRDLFGIKPVWFVHDKDNFAFASEKKVLEKLGYIDPQELNPRNILKYGLEEKPFLFANFPKA